MRAQLLSYTTTINETAIHAAMTDIALALVDDIPVDFDCDNQLAAVSRAPVALAVAFADVCALLGIAPPAFVRLALDQLMIHRRASPSRPPVTDRRDTR
jgi:hypothetical protein